MMPNRSVMIAAAVLVTLTGVRGKCAAATHVPSPADEAVARGDESYERDALPAALSAYDSALALDAGHLGALCGLARAGSELGTRARGEQQRRLIADAVEHGRAAVKSAPDSARGHLWLAVALRRQAGGEGPRTRAALMREIKSELDRALALDPTLARAWHERGLWHWELSHRGLWERAWSFLVLARMPRGASEENAVRDLQRAVALAPGSIEFRLALGRVLFGLERMPEARRELEQALSLAASGPRDPGRQAEARELLGRIAKRG